MWATAGSGRATGLPPTGYDDRVRYSTYYVLGPSVEHATRLNGAGGPERAARLSRAPHGYQHVRKGMPAP